MHSSRMRTARSSSCWGEGVGVCLSACWDTPRVWAWRPPWPDSSTSPLVVAWRPARHAGIPPPPRDLLQGMLEYHLQCMLGYHTHPPREQNHRQV